MFMPLEMFKYLKCDMEAQFISIIDQSSMIAFSYFLFLGYTFKALKSQINYIIVCQFSKMHLLKLSSASFLNNGKK